MDELESTADSQGESPFGEVRSPRLSILHLMLWTLCSAVYLSLIRAIYALQGDSPVGNGSMRDTTSVLQGMITGAVLTGAVVLVSTRVRCGRPMLRQPGHWLLFVVAIFQSIYLPLFFSITLLQRVFDSRGTLPLAFYSFVYLVPAIAYAIAARYNLPLRWKITFVAFAAVGLAQSLSYIGFWLAAVNASPWLGYIFALPRWGRILVTGAMVVVSIVDVLAGKRYDWLHWTGVTTHMAGACVMLMWVIWSWFVR